MTPLDECDLVYVGSRGSTIIGFDNQPTTEDIAFNKHPTDRYCVQLIGYAYEVYDLKTLKDAQRFMSITIGLPVFSHKDADVAIMWALMNL